jgi:pimeloyl-ACP methyl ester carboxylesterase
VIRATHLTTDDGTVLAATVRPAPVPRGAVVVAHGFSGNQNQVEVIAVAEALVAVGFSAITYDARGHGASGGVCTLGDLEELDVRAAAELAAQESDRISLVGASMGAIAVLRYAVTDPSVASIVTVSSPAVWRVPRSARGMLSVLITQTPPGRRLAAAHLGVRLGRGRVRGVPPVQLAAQLRSPLAVVHGRCDRFVSTSQAKTLYGAAGGPRRLMLVTGMGHAYDAAAVPAIVAGMAWGFERSEGGKLVGSAHGVPSA